MTEQSPTIQGLYEPGDVGNYWFLLARVLLAKFNREKVVFYEQT